MLLILISKKKTFDKVPRRALLSKLCAYGLHVILVTWIEDFLCQRKQVRLNGLYCHWLLVLYLQRDVRRVKDLCDRRLFKRQELYVRTYVTLID